MLHSVIADAGTALGWIGAFSPIILAIAYWINEDAKAKAARTRAEAKAIEDKLIAEKVEAVKETAAVAASESIKHSVALEVIRKDVNSNTQKMLDQSAEQGRQLAALALEVGNLKTEKAQLIAAAAAAAAAAAVNLPDKGKGVP